MDVIIVARFGPMLLCQLARESTEVIIFCQSGAEKKRRRRKTQGIFSYLYL
jgi:hypothetical protein